MKKIFFLLIAISAKTFYSEDQNCDLALLPGEDCEVNKEKGLCVYGQDDKLYCKPGAGKDCSSLGDDCKSQGDEGICGLRGCGQKILCCDTISTNIVSNNQDLFNMAINAIEKFQKEHPEKITPWVLRLKLLLKGQQKIPIDFWDYVNDAPEATKIEVTSKNPATKQEEKDIVQMFPTDKACAGLRPLAPCKCPDNTKGQCWVSKEARTYNGENLSTNTLFCNCVG